MKGGQNGSKSILLFGAKLKLQPLLENSSMRSIKCGKHFIPEHTATIQRNVLVSFFLVSSAMF